jgi:hypothetical protein
MFVVVSRSKSSRRDEDGFLGPDIPLSSPNGRHMLDRMIKHASIRGTAQQVTSLEARKTVAKLRRELCKARKWLREGKIEKAEALLLRHSVELDAILRNLNRSDLTH